MKTDIDPMLNHLIETNKHIAEVKLRMNMIAEEIFNRADYHDCSKMRSPEAEIFVEYTPKLKNCTYGSEEYKQFLSEMDIALKHHYEYNRHHPEHFLNGIMNMTLVDLIEMICDWKAATLRHNDGDIYKSIELNQKRFNYSDELKQILINTVKKEIDKIEE